MVTERTAPVRALRRQEMATPTGDEDEVREAKRTRTRSRDQVQERWGPTHLEPTEEREKEKEYLQ